MKVLQKILFTFALVVGMTISVSAQKGGSKKAPPKAPPPVINPGEGKKPPKNDDKQKKPAYTFVVWKSDANETA